MGVNISNPIVLAGIQQQQQQISQAEQAREQQIAQIQAPLQFSQQQLRSGMIGYQQRQIAAQQQAATVGKAQQEYKAFQQQVTPVKEQLATAKSQIEQYNAEVSALNTAEALFNSGNMYIKSATPPLVQKYLTELEAGRDASARLAEVNAKLAEIKIASNHQELFTSTFTPQQQSQLIAGGYYNPTTSTMETYNLPTIKSITTASTKPTYTPMTFKENVAEQGGYLKGSLAWLGGKVASVPLFQDIAAVSIYSSIAATEAAQGKTDLLKKPVAEQFFKNIPEISQLSTKTAVQLAPYFTPAAPALLATGFLESIATPAGWNKFQRDYTTYSTPVSEGGYGFNKQQAIGATFAPTFIEGAAGFGGLRTQLFPKITSTEVKVPTIAPKKTSTTDLGLLGKPEIEFIPIIKGKIVQGLTYVETKINQGIVKPIASFYNTKIQPAINLRITAFKQSLPIQTKPFTYGSEYGMLGRGTWLEQSLAKARSIGRTTENVIVGKLKYGKDIIFGSPEKLSIQQQYMKALAAREGGLLGKSGTSWSEQILAQEKTISEATQRFTLGKLKYTKDIIFGSPEKLSIEQQTIRALSQREYGLLGRGKPLFQPLISKVKDVGSSIERFTIGKTTHFKNIIFGSPEKLSVEQQYMKALSQRPQGLLGKPSSTFTEQILAQESKISSATERFTIGKLKYAKDVLFGSPSERIIIDKSALYKLPEPQLPKIIQRAKTILIDNYMGKYTPKNIATITRRISNIDNPIIAKIPKQSSLVPPASSFIEKPIIFEYVRKKQPTTSLELVGYNKQGGAIFRMAEKPVTPPEPSDVLTKSGQILITKTEQVPEVITIQSPKIISIQQTKVRGDIILLPKLRSSQIQLMDTKSVVETIPATKTTPLTLEITRTIQAPNIASIQLPALDFAQLSLTETAQATRTATQQMPKEILGFPPIYPTEERKRKAAKIFGIAKAYKTLVKRRGKFFEVGKLLPKGEAVKLGEKRTRGTLGRTFKVEEMKAEVPTLGLQEYKPSAKEFREFQIRKGARIPLKDTFIKIKPLQTRSEVSEIQAARRSKGKMFGGKIKL